MISTSNMVALVLRKLSSMIHSEEGEHNAGVKVSSMFYALVLLLSAV